MNEMRLPAAGRVGRTGSGVMALARRVVLDRLRRLRHGQICLVEGDDRTLLGQADEQFPVRAEVRVRDPRFYVDLLLGGTIGAAEAYMDGRWEADSLTDVIRIASRNMAVMDGMERGVARVALAVHGLLSRFRRNTRRGARRNIAAHYDLGNDFFAAFLDETMMYSSAVFERDDMSLYEASVAKLERICRKLDLRPGDRVLEIGSGWGGFAMHAARHYGCHVTTTTISRAQYELAVERVRRAGLSDRVTVLCEDYRDLGGLYDKMVSIEMIEAVGHEFFDTYFEKVSSLLRPEGMFLMQAITIADQRYEQARRSVDFIQRYIFPGGSLPSVARIAEAIARRTDMRMFHLEDIGPHYARTLRDWRDRFASRLAGIAGMGYPEEFLRMWEYYFCYCEGAFEERVIGAAQFVFTKPLCRREALIHLPHCGTGWRKPALALASGGR